MKFELGKYYRHATGEEIYIIGTATNPIYSMGPGLVAEKLGDGSISLVGTHEDAVVNWVECSPWIIKNANVYSAKEMISDIAKINASTYIPKHKCKCSTQTIVNHGCKCGGT